MACMLVLLVYMSRFISKSLTVAFSPIVTAVHSCSLAMQAPIIIQSCSPIMQLWDCPTVSLQYHNPAVYTMGLWDYPYRVEIFLVHNTVEIITQQK